MNHQLVNSNEGIGDRVIRIIIGVVLVAMAVTGPRIAWGWIGAVLLVTGLVGFCPLYRVFGLNTCARGAR